MSLDLHHEPVELDDLLAFVRDIGLGNGEANATKLQTSRPNEELEMTDDAWFEGLFGEETEPPLKCFEHPATDAAKPYLRDNIDDKCLKTLTLPEEAPFSNPARKMAGARE
ncbi:hypothetical protein ON010_g14334 [Phytophthora cinnamomi]|nr:hypothetical protein ON010_g14334 [Phytophthora cinnamomi]